MIDSQAPDRKNDGEDVVKLERALDYLRPKLRARIDIPDSEIEAVAAMMTLMRVMVTQAESILVLARTEFAEAGGSNLRTMFEAWCDIRIILGEGDLNENGRRFRIFGLLEIGDFMRATASARDDNAKEIETVEKELAPYEKNYPDLVAAVKAERKKKSKLWSGKTRSSMLHLLSKSSTREESAPNSSERPALLDMFKFLSWDSHNIVTGVLDVTIDEDERGEIRLNFGHRQTQAESGEFNCGLAALMLSDSWLHFARAFNLPTPRSKNKD
jgi:hypothetical protein